MNNERLLPCPLGGQDVKLSHDTSSDYERYWTYFVESSLCEGLRYSTAEEAVKAWNTRPPANDADVVEVMEQIARNICKADMVLPDELSMGSGKPRWTQYTKQAQAALTALQSAGYRITKEFAEVADNNN